MLFGRFADSQGGIDPFAREKRHIDPVLLDPLRGGPAGAGQRGGPEFPAQNEDFDVRFFGERDGCLKRIGHNGERPLRQQRGQLQHGGARIEKHRAPLLDPRQSGPRDPRLAPGVLLDPLAQGKIPVPEFRFRRPAVRPGQLPFGLQFFKIPPDGFLGHLQLGRQFGGSHAPLGIQGLKDFAVTIKCKHTVFTLGFCVFI